ncbi:hypothetical protein ACFY74_33375 [Streptomyces massasporeus]|uniref:hypothetical protein n=1 Tax=Streptomyces massasporeus TaxID=67324 RepID=UPI0036AB0AD2
MADTWTIVAAASGIFGNITAIAVSIASIRRADAALVQARDIATQHLAAEGDYTGAATNIAWREQIMNLHDRGLDPDQIRRIMHLETGGDTWEDSVGRIDDILRDIPRQPPAH